MDVDDNEVISSPFSQHSGVLLVQSYYKHFAGEDCVSGLRTLLLLLLLAEVQTCACMVQTCACITPLAKCGTVACRLL